MPIDRRVADAALREKGFRPASGDHVYYIYYSTDGKKSNVRTKISHGNHKDIGDQLVSMMAKQCKLSKADFKNLIACPLSRDEYERKLSEQNILD